ncbi:MAG: iron-containing alcohol dehydrogenase, partial [Candidatus Aenigmarchaeota archaeon]|nr:iron-containing alcohol dehydrogenase [Candidatus Aenigmarchaeota archaeon]
MEISELPRKVLIDKGAVNKIAGVVSGLGKRVLVVVDPITKDIAGDFVSKQVEGKLFSISGSTIEEVKRAEAEGVDCIISVGGGKVIDVGKLAAHNKKIPFISIPTACSHDGIVSKNASITENNVSKSFSATTPFGLIADLDILSKAPYRLTASGAADIISNYTSVFDWRLAKEQGEEYDEGAAKLALMSAELVSSSVKAIRSKSEGGMRNLVWSLLYSGMSMTLAGSSRPASGAEHMFSHALDSLGSKGIHGEQVGLGAIIFAYLQGQDWKNIKSLLEEVGAPVTAEQAGIGKDLIIEALLKAKDIR